MDHYSILDGHSSHIPKTSVPQPDPTEPSRPSAGDKPSPLRFPGSDGGKSLAEVAQRDLDAALQLLAERAQYITGASGAAIALRQGEEMICRASVGPSAPELGAHLQVNSGLSGESVRTRKVLRCDDAETDPRVNRESCSMLGIASVVVMPLVREEKVNGVFELLSGRAYAFEERDLAALERLGEMIQTAVEHAEAARRTQAVFSKENEEVLLVDDDVRAAPEEENAESTHNPGSELQSEPTPTPNAALEPERDSAVTAQPEPVAAPELPTPVAKSSALLSMPTSVPVNGGEPAQKECQPETLPSEPAKIKRCDACGFPISEGRKLCLDCEKAQPAGESGGPALSSEAPDFLAQFAHEDQGWLRSHIYLVGALLLAAVTILMLVWRAF